MNTKKAQSQAERKRKLSNRKRRIPYRLRHRFWTDQAKPMFTAANIHYAGLFMNVDAPNRAALVNHPGSTTYG